jgi:hypothetical protein
VAPNRVSARLVSTYDRPLNNDEDQRGNCDPNGVEGQVRKDEPAYISVAWNISNTPEQEAKEKKVPGHLPNRKDEKHRYQLEQCAA